MPRAADSRRIAWAELNLLNATGALADELEGARIGKGTPVHDLGGEELFHRYPLAAPRRPLGYADVAVHAAFGAPLLSVSQGFPWDEQALVRQATQAARKRAGRLKWDEIRFVAYSYPKVAVQFLAGGEEVLLLELATWQPVPAAPDRRPYEPPSDFERWSFLAELRSPVRRRNESRYRKRLDRWEELLARARSIRTDAILLERFGRYVDLRPDLLLDTRELHYSRVNSDHFTCYEVRGQQTNVWCVAASVEMILDFYRYEYTQVRLAQELGLGTLANPNGLPYSRDGDVVTVLGNMTSAALTGSMNTSPSWTEFRSEIRDNRPLISFVPGHARTVAGYTRSGILTLGLAAFRGLLVYDPWPPTTGVITRWENFDAQTYRVTFTARL
ncbi:MAG: C39 family peptidase, partial [Gaiellaceae bacterium]